MKDLSDGSLESGQTASDEQLKRWCGNSRSRKALKDEVKENEVEVENYL